MPPSSTSFRQLISAISLALGLTLLVSSLVSGAAQAAEDTQWGVVTGLVTDQAGVPIPRIDLVARSAAAPPYKNETEGDGTLAWDLPEGEYQITVGEQSVDFEPVVVNVTVVADQRTAIGTVVLTRLPSQTISGTVRTRGTQAAIQGAEVELVRLLGEGPPYEDYEIVAQTTTNASGGYQFPDVQFGKGRVYTIGAQAAGHSSAYLGDETDPLTSDTDDTLDETRTQPSVLELTASPQVRGVVTRPSPSGPVGVAGVEVQLFRWDEVSEEFFMFGNTVSRSGGSYSITLTAPGPHTLYFDNAQVSDQVESAWLGGEVPTGPGSPGVFAVPAPLTELVKNHQLTAPLTASGTVRGSDGSPRPGVTVTAYDWDGLYFSETGSSTTTAADGSFRLPLPRERWVTFSFEGPGVRRVFLGGGPIPESAEPPHSLYVDSSLQLGVVVDGVASPSGPSPSPTPTPTPTPTTPDPTPTTPSTPTSTPAPTTSATPTDPGLPAVAVGSTLSLKGPGQVRRKGTWKVRAAVGVDRGGSTAGTLELRRGKKLLVRVKLTAGKKTVQLRVSGKKLAGMANAKGLVKVRAIFSGNPDTESARSRVATVRVVR